MMILLSITRNKLKKLAKMNYRRKTNESINQCFLYVCRDMDGFD